MNTPPAAATAGPQARPETKEQIQAAILYKARAFLTVFGDPKNRSPEQRLVLQQFATYCGDDENLFQFGGNPPRDGAAVALAAAQRDGALIPLRLINRNVRLALELKTPKAVPSVKR
jgi:hypothetical protein